MAMSLASAERARVHSVHVHTVHRCTVSSFAARSERSEERARVHFSRGSCTRARFGRYLKGRRPERTAPIPTLQHVIGNTIQHARTPLPEKRIST